VVTNIFDFWPAVISMQVISNLLPTFKATLGASIRRKAGAAERSTDPGYSYGS